MYCTIHYATTFYPVVFDIILVLEEKFTGAEKLQCSETDQKRPGKEWVIVLTTVKNSNKEMSLLDVGVVMLHLTMGGATNINVSSSPEIRRPKIKKNEDGWCKLQELQTIVALLETELKEQVDHNTAGQRDSTIWVGHLQR